MQVSNQKPSGFTAEVRLIAEWAWVLAGVGFLCMQFVFNVVIAQQHDAPPAWARTFLGLLVGIILAGYFLLIGYVNRDSGRRGMSRALWTAIAVLVPNGLGIILYFILRQPLVDTCPQCGHAVQHGFNFCPKCNCKLNPSCPQCQRMVRPEDVFCPYCGTSLQPQTPLPAAPQPESRS